MAQVYQCTINSHYNIYSGEEREINYSISLPDKLNENTGLILIAYGYGGYYNANIFRKLMEIIPDKHNFAVINCDFFGGRFFKDSFVEIDLTDGYFSHETEDCYRIDIAGENEHDFNDMGIMQALDNVYATLDALKYLPGDHSKRHVIAFGSSHGGYIAHLANLICPNLYSTVLDISSYLFPYYLDKLRKVDFQSDFIKMNLGFRYYISEHKEYQLDDELLDLNSWYVDTQSQCKVIAFHGVHDWMVDYREKQKFIVDLKERGDFMLFSPEDVDGVFVKNDSHGLDMNFEVLFEMILPLLREQNPMRSVLIEGEKVYCSDKIRVDYCDGKPVVKQISGKQQIFSK